MTPIETRIRELCRERQAVILAHNYTLPDVQDIADFTGDSLDLSIRAARTQAKVIVFCGVRFMAETAKILSPASRVLMPDPRAGCPMADMITAAQVRQARREHPDALVVCYVNSSAEVKAEVDICCTSSNAREIVRSLPADRPILFVPDRNLGAWVRETTGRDMILWNGFCPTHHRILPEHIRAMKAAHPEALVVAHPECVEGVRTLADHLASTSGILAYCRASPRREFIIGTEVGLLHRLRRENPDKLFYAPSPRGDCPNMKKTTVEKILWCLQDMTGEITVDEAIAARARQAIDRMLAVVPSPAAPRV